MLLRQTQHSFQHDGDETTVIYSEVNTEVKEVVATQVDEKGKEEVATQVDEKGKTPGVGEKVKGAVQTAEEMQRDEEGLADQSNKEEESECMHVHFRESSYT